MNPATGHLFDGETARPVPVALEFTAAGELLVTGDNLARTYPVAALRASDRLGDVPRFLYLPDGATIESPANAVIDAALRGQPRARAARVIHFLESRQRIAVAACVLLVALVGLLGFYGPPTLARIVAARVPAEVDRKIGALALAAITPYFQPTQLPAAERERVERQLTRLRPPESGPRPQLTFLSMNGGLPNAFALPGNTIVMTDELVRLPATDDEIAAVLAHELAHLDRRHGLQSLLRQSFAVLLAAGITGDASALTTFAAAIPLSLLTAGYSRDLEREADIAALDLLRARGIPPRAFAAVIVKLDASRESLQRNSTYTSTHPSTEERTARFGGLAPAERAAVLAEPAAAQAVAAMRRGAPGEALPHLDRLVALHPVARSFTLRARCHYELQRFDAARSDLTRALELAPDDLDARLLRLELLVLGGPADDEGPAEARALLTAHPKNATALALLGYAEAQQGKRDLGLAGLDEAVALEPTGYLGWALRGAVHDLRGAPAAAEPDLDKAIGLEPGVEWLYGLRGRVRLHLRKHTGALSDFARVNTPALQTAAYFYDRGSAELALNRFPRAVDDFGRGLALRPKGGALAQLHHARGTAHLRQANFTSAEKDFTAALAAGSTHWRVYLQRAAALRRLGRLREALPDLAAATRAAGDTPAALTEIRLEEIITHFDLADFDAAAAGCAAVLASGPHPGALQLRGIVRFAEGNWSAADADLSQALTLARRPHDEYFEFFRLLARRRLGVDEHLKDFTVVVTGWRPGWGKSIGRYLGGQLTEERLLAEADFSTGTPTQKERRCEAYFYIGVTALIAGDAAKAQSYFQRCIETGVINFYEYRLARAELARLRRAP